MLRKITLYGELGEKFGKNWELDVRTPAEAIKAIEANIPGFYNYLSEEGRCFHVIKDTKADREELDLDGVTGPLGNSELKIIPVVHGAKSGFGKFILGALMVVAVVYTAGWAATAGAGLGGTGFAGTMQAGMTALTGGGTVVGGTLTGVASPLMTGLAKLGMGIALHGISQMLAPTPKKPVNTEVDNGASYNFNGPVNTITQGVPVPVCYGRLIVGGAVISAGIKSEDIGGPNEI